MGQTLDQAGEKSHVVEIVYHGDQLIIPDGMSLDETMKLIKSRKEYLETKVDMQETFDVFPWDGANAIHEVLTKKFGWSQSKATPGFWGPTPPKLISIDVGYNKKKSVPWGSFSLPNVAGLLTTGFQWNGNRMVFTLIASVLRKDEATVKDVFERVREFLKTGSIYRGKAIKLRFLDDDGDDLPMPEPKFLQVGLLREEHLIYSKSVQDAIKVNLFTPIERVQDCIDNGIPVKRGVLLGGVFGTGKTLAATVAAHLAQDHGITYIYTPRADELAKTIEFAKQYQSPACVVFCEDVDRVLSGERDVEMDDILNIIDGIDTKEANIITVLTTNNMGAINAAMLRPGRLDAVIEIPPPDGEAVQRLLRMYGSVNIDPATDLTLVGDKLAGNIPAVIMETVKRAKLSQLRLQKPGEKVKFLSEPALLEAAHTMGSQIKLLNDASAPKVPDITIDSTVQVLMERVLADKLSKLDEVTKAVEEIKAQVC